MYKLKIGNEREKNSNDLNGYLEKEMRKFRHKKR